MSHSPFSRLRFPLLLLAVYLLGLLARHGGTLGQVIDGAILAVVAFFALRLLRAVPAAVRSGRAYRRAVREARQ